MEADLPWLVECPLHTRQTQVEQMAVWNVRDKDKKHNRMEAVNRFLKAGYVG